MRTSWVLIGEGKNKEMLFDRLKGTVGKAQQQKSLKFYRSAGNKQKCFTEITNISQIRSLCSSESQQPLRPRATSKEINVDMKRAPGNVSDVRRPRVSQTDTRTDGPEEQAEM